MSRTPVRRYELKEPELNRSIDALIADAESSYGAIDHSEFVRQIVVTALRLIQDRTSRADVKLINSALKELRHAFRVFQPYEHVRKVTVFGSARTPRGRPEWVQARDFARRLADEGWMTITGAGAGVMGAAQEGAGRDASFGVNIRLPFEQRANEVIAGDPKLMHFRYFFTRKVMFVKEAHAFALFPGGFGTHDEAFEALTLIQTGKSEIYPIVLVDAPGGSYWQDWKTYVDRHLLGTGHISGEDTHLFRITDDVDTAVEEVLNFYSNYHSSRYVGDQLVLRVRQAPDETTLEEWNRDFKDLLGQGRIVVRDPLPEEAGDAPQCHRIVLHFNRRDAGRLRRLIDCINDLVSERTSPAREASPHQIVEEAVPAEAERAELETD